MTLSLADKIKQRQEAAANKDEDQSQAATPNEAPVSKGSEKTSPSKAIMDRILNDQQDPNGRNLLISQIDVDEQVRVDFDGIQELADSIEDGVLIQPISVVQHSANRYTLLSGERRFRAFRDVLKRDVIPVQVIDVENVVMPGVDSVASKIAVLRITENTNRANLRPFETANGLLKIKQETGLSNVKLAKYVGMSEGYISKYLSLFKVPPVIKKALEERELSATRWFDKQNDVLKEYGLLDDASLDGEGDSKDKSSGAAKKTADKIKTNTISIDFDIGLSVAKLLKKLSQQNDLLPIEYDLVEGGISKKELVALINARTKDILDQS